MDFSIFQNVRLNDTDGAILTRKTRNFLKGLSILDSVCPKTQGIKLRAQEPQIF